MNVYQESQIISRPKWLGGGNWNLSRLTPVTVLFGKNGSGKSLLLRQWRDHDSRSCHYVVPERTGDLTFEPGLLQQQMDPEQRKQHSNRNYTFNYRQQIIARIQAYFLARGSVRVGEIPGNPSELEKLLSKLLPDFSVTLHGANPPYVLLRADGSAVPSIDHLSSGEAQLFTIALDILTVAAIWDLENLDKRIMLLDEPDAHIHPDLQVRFADFLIETARKFKLQIIVATHSTTLLSAIGLFGAENAGIIYLRKEQENFRAEPFNDVLKELATCLGGHALMGPLFSVPILLVEGDDDYRIWSQVPRYHKVSFSVLPCNGEEIKRYQRALEKIFASLRTTKELAGYALLDGDKPLPSPNPDSPQDYIRYIRLGCHEAENLYLTDTVLSLFDMDWETACNKIVEAADSHGEKAALLASAKSWDRKNEDIKGVIHQITQIIDPKNVHWTIRVATALGKDRPRGELADLLGEAVVRSLWGEEVPSIEPAQS